MINSLMNSNVFQNAGGEEGVGVVLVPRLGAYNRWTYTDVLSSVVEL